MGHALWIFTLVAALAVAPGVYLVGAHVDESLHPERRGNTRIDVMRVR